MAAPVFFSDGHTPKYSDSKWRILQKILGALNDAGGPGDPANVRMGPGAPSTPGGDTYIFYVRTKTGCNSLWWWNPLLAVWFEMNGEDFTGNYTCPTIVELRAIPTVDCPPVSAITFGNLVVDDGQGAHYHWGDSDSQSDNGMSIIKPDDVAAADPGRWLQFSPA